MTARDARSYPPASLRRARILLAVARMAGQTGSWAALVAALPLALARPDPGLWLSVITAAWAAPAAVVELPALAGRLADSPLCGPRRAGVASWAVAAAAATYVTTSRHPHLSLIIAALAVTSAGRGAGVVAGDTAPSWIPGRPDAGVSAAWLMLGDTLPVAAGPLGAAALLHSRGPGAAWFVTGALFEVAAVAAALVPATRPEAGPAAVTVPAAGRRLAPPRVLAMLFCTAGIWLAYGGMEVLQPLYVKDGLHSPLIVYGWTMAANAVAGSGTALAAMGERSPLRPFLTSRWGVPLSALGVTGGLRLFTATSSVRVALAGSAVWGAAAVLFTLSSKEVILAEVAKRSHGQAMALWRAVQSGGYTAPEAVTGPLTATYGLIRMLVGVCALAGASALCHTAGTALSGAARPGARGPADPARARPAAPGPGLWRINPADEQAPCNRAAGGLVALDQVKGDAARLVRGAL